MRTRISLCSEHAQEEQEPVWGLLLWGALGKEGTFEADVRIKGDEEVEQSRILFLWAWSEGLGSWEGRETTEITRCKITHSTVESIGKQLHRILYGSFKKQCLFTGVLAFVGKLVTVWSKLHFWIDKPIRWRKEKGGLDCIEPLKPKAVQLFLHMGQEIQESLDPMGTQISRCSSALYKVA